MNRSANVISPLGSSQAQMGGHYQKEVKVLNMHGQYLCEQRIPEANPTSQKFQNVQKTRKHQLNRDINLDSFRCIREGLDNLLSRNRGQCWGMSLGPCLEQFPGLSRPSQIQNRTNALVSAGKCITVMNLTSSADSFP